MSLCLCMLWLSKQIKYARVLYGVSDKKIILSCCRFTLLKQTYLIVFVANHFFNTDLRENKNELLNRWCECFITRVLIFRKPYLYSCLWETLFGMKTRRVAHIVWIPSILKSSMGIERNVYNNLYSTTIPYTIGKRSLFIFKFG